jgi:hypothetical protein
LWWEGLGHKDHVWFEIKAWYSRFMAWIHSGLDAAYLKVEGSGGRWTVCRTWRGYLMVWNILKLGKCLGLEWLVWDLVTIRLGGVSGGDEWEVEEEWGRKGWGSWWREGEGSDGVSKWVEDSSNVVDVTECSGWGAEISCWAGRGEGGWMNGVCVGWGDGVSMGLDISSIRLDDASTELKSECNWDGMRTSELPGEVVTLQEPSEEEGFFAGNWVSSNMTFLDKYTLVW